MEILKIVNTILLVISMFPLVWALLDILKALPEVAKQQKTMGFLLATGYLMMGLVATLSLLAYVTEGGHILALWRTTGFAVANLSFGTAYILVRKGLI